MSVGRKGGNAIAGFFLAHGEKLGIALIVMLVGWLLYGSTQYEGVDKRPNDLSTLASEARTNFERFVWEDAKNEPEGAKLAEEFQPLATVSLDAQNYAVDENGWNQAIVPPIVLRTDPPLLAAIGLTGSGGTELMGFRADRDRLNNIQLDSLRKELQEEQERKAEAERRANEERGGSRADELEREETRRVVNRNRGGASVDENDLREVVSYATVLAKVPVHAQTQAYWSTFENALEFNRSSDQPIYLGYFVERREVNAGKAGEWKKVSLRNGINSTPLPGVDADTILVSTADWVEKLDDPAARIYSHEVLTFPVPPIIGRPWGPEAIHPDVPTEAEMERERDEDKGLRGGFRGRELRSQGGGFLAAGPDDDEELEEEDPFIDSIYETPFVMLRFFDLTVQAGRQYQYRVQLVLEDPNAAVSKNALDKAILARFEADSDDKDDKRDLSEDEIKFVMSEWSEPTAPISVPQAGGVSLASIRPAQSGAVNAEPSVNLWVNSFDTQQGKLVESALEQTFQRGGVANFRENDVWYIDGSSFLQAEEYRYRTDVTVMDIFGGGKLGREDSTPAKILVMDASGRLSVHNELTDSRDVRDTKDRYLDEEETSGGGRSSRGSGDFGGDFGF